MGAFRSLVLLLAIFAVAWLVRQSSSRQRRVRQTNRRSVPAEMRRCAYCGVHSPVSAGVLAKGAFYCSEDHWRAAQKR
jgi:uncharacterized protein